MWQIIVNFAAGNLIFMNLFMNLKFVAVLTLLAGAGEASATVVAQGDTLLTAGEVFSLMPDTVATVDSEAKENIAMDSVAMDSVALPPTSQRVMDRINRSENADRYRVGIIPEIARYSADYAWRLLDNEAEGFLIVDKGAMTVTFFDRYGAVVKRFPIACARNYGDKRRTGDNRTPEGFFSVHGVYNSTGWLYHGAPHQFGPRFIRLKTPVSMSIGIHGTSAPGSIGGRRSHGCIRTLNKHILELAPLVKAGMPVIVVPGLKDMQVNSREGRSTVWVPGTHGAVMPGAAAKAAKSAGKKRRR